MHIGQDLNMDLLKGLMGGGFVEWHEVAFLIDKASVRTEALASSPHGLSESDLVGKFIPVKPSTLLQLPDGPPLSFSPFMAYLSLRHLE